MDLLYIYILGALILIVLIWLIVLEMRLRKLFRGSDGKDIEGIIGGIKKDIENLNRREGDMEEYIKDAEPRLRMSVKHVGMIRYDSYQGAGGGQSFSIALLDEDKHGVVVSSLYGRDANRVYAKPIESGESKYRLSGEEEESIKKALTKEV